MSTISKEAREAADKLTFEYMPDHLREAQIQKVAQIIQSLLDAQKSESEKVIETLEQLDSSSCDHINALDATITELRAACAEKNEALKANGVFHTPIALSRKTDRQWDDYEIDAINRSRAALSSHGESILAELARLKEELTATKRQGNEDAQHACELLAENKALRASAEAAENKNTEVAKLIDESMELCRKNGIPVPASLFQAKAVAALASQPPQQGDKAPS